MRETTAVPYQRRREAGLASREQTRRRLLAAADLLFREQGYSATTVTAIADRAEVSLQTLYLAWGSKSALFRAAADAAAAASGLPLSPENWHDVLHAALQEGVAGNPTTAAYLAAVSHLFVEVAGRTVPYWQLQASAGAADPDIAAGHRDTMARRRITMQGVAERIPRSGLRPDLTAGQVADTVWALASPDLFALFTTQAAATPADFEKWLTDTLVSALCVDRRPSP